MKINYLLLRLTREKYINRWVILLIDLFLSVFSTITSLALISYILAYIIHSGFISGYQNRYGDNLKPPTNVYHRMTA